MTQKTPTAPLQISLGKRWVNPQQHSQLLRWRRNHKTPATAITTPLKAAYPAPTNPNPPSAMMAGTASGTKHTLQAATKPKPTNTDFLLKRIDLILNFHFIPKRCTS